MLYIQTSIDIAVKNGTSKYILVFDNGRLFDYKPIKDTKITHKLDSIKDIRSISQSLLKEWWRL